MTSKQLRNTKKPDNHNLSNTQAQVRDTALVANFRTDQCEMRPVRDGFTYKRFFLVTLYSLNNKN